MVASIWDKGRQVPQMDVSEPDFSLMSKGSLDNTIYRKMSLLISSGWVRIIDLLFFVFRVIVLHIFRIRMNDGSCVPAIEDSKGVEPLLKELEGRDCSLFSEEKTSKDGSCAQPIENSEGLEPPVKATELEKRGCSLFSDEETSSFRFKFEYQLTEDYRALQEHAISVTNEKILSETAEISKYCFLPKKDFSGFIEEPGPMTLCVQESYAERSGDYEHGTEKLGTENTTGFLSAKGLQQFRGFGDSNVESEAEMLSKSKLSEEEITMMPESDSLDENDSAGFYKEPKNMNYCGWSNAKENIDAPGKDFVQSNVLNNLNKLVISEDIIQLVNKLWDQEIHLGSQSSLSDEKDSSSIVEESEPMSFHDRGSDFDCTEDDIDDKEKLDTEITTGFLLSKDFQQPNTFAEFVKTKESRYATLKEAFLVQDLYTSSETSSMDKNEVLYGVRFASESFSDFDSDTESISVSYSVKDLVVDPDSDGFLSERDFDEYGSEVENTQRSSYSNGLKVRQPEDLRELDSNPQLIYSSSAYYADSGRGVVYSKNQTSYDDITEEFPPKREICEKIEMPWSNGYQIEFTESGDDLRSSFGTDSNRLSSSDDSFLENQDLEGEDSRTLSELQCSESDHLHSLNNSSAKFDDSIGMISAPTNHSEQMDAIPLQRNTVVMREPEDLPSKKTLGESERKKYKETLAEDMDSKDSDELESLWEHQFLIEQLKMELKKVRAIGLPTIFEESESPKASEDLKPWKIEENLLHEDTIDELHKFYKSYRERMRKFDILNYQKMYAIGFLRLKDPLQSIGSQKPLIPTLMAHLSENFFWPFCHPKSSNDPSVKFLKELQSDLETIYVGQTCLSWEFLRWQYEKTRGLPESDPYRSHQYNQVAGEFQQFQVIIQRYIENESFQGPRLPNYVKNRCVLRNLIQVPVVKEDCLKDKMEEQKNGKDAITSEMLEDVMEESIRIFWKFVKADKNESPMILKGFIGSHVELQDPSDSELLMHVQLLLQKREKKLKDILRSGNCLVKKFKKPQEHRINQDLFFCQVDMKLVSMVLNMSRIATEQLVWCHKKLNKITFEDRKVRREPSFLLFPC